MIDVNPARVINTSPPSPPLPGETRIINSNLISLVSQPLTSLSARIDGMHKC